jgi:hypothetical protein
MIKNIKKLNDKTGKSLFYLLGEGISAGLGRSAKPIISWLWSRITGMTSSWQTGLGPNRFRKLHSFLVACEAACSSGDFPVATVVVILAAVIGLAITAVVIAPPTAFAVAAIGNAQPDKNKALNPIITVYVRPCHAIQRQ